MSTSVDTSYDAKIAALKAAGLKTTRLNKNEANFADYFNVLNSTEAGKKLMSTLGGDASIQNMVAGLYKTKSNYTFDELKKLLAKQGIKVSAKWTTGVNHMADQKAVGVGNEQISKSGITVITFEKDGKTFKVADANGNAALETEELMFNNILGDINADLNIMASGNNATDVTNKADSNKDNSGSLFAKSLEEQDKARESEEQERIEKLKAEVENQQAEIEKAKSQQFYINKAEEYKKENNVDFETAMTSVLVQYGFYK